MKDVFIHQSAIVESSRVGKGTSIWAFVHVMKGAEIGMNCNIGDNVFIETDVIIGDGVTVKNNVLLWKGVTVENYVFLGPGVVFTNDMYPRSPRSPVMPVKYRTEGNWLKKTIVEQGASIGANATVLCGLTLGRYCMVAAGSVVTKNIPPYRLVAGNPARLIGYVDRTGCVLVPSGRGLRNTETGCLYRLVKKELVEVAK